MAGGIWSALGAAILGGNNGYQQARNEQFVRNRATQNDQVMNTMRQIQMAMEQANAMENTEGATAYNSPAFLAARQRAGAPITTQPPVEPYLDSVKLGPGGIKDDSRAAEAARRGIAPDTGAIIPGGVRLKEAQEQTAFAKNDLVHDMMTGGGVPGQAPGHTFQRDANGVIVDSPANRQLGAVLGNEDPMTKIHGPASMAPENVVASVNARNSVNLSASAKKMLEGIESSRRIIGEIKPILTAHNPEDPTGQQTGIGHLLMDKAKAIGNYGMYKAGFPVEPQNEKLIQLSSLLRIMGASPFMSGSRNFKLIEEIWNHLADPTSTPEATMQRMNQLERMLPEIEASVRAAQTGHISPGAEVSADFDAPGAPQGAPQAPPQAAAPQGAAAPQAAAPQAAAPMVKAGDRVTYADVVDRARRVGVDPNKMAAGLIARGVVVTR